MGLSQFGRAVIAAVLVVAAVRPRRVAVIGTAAIGAVVGPLVWNAIRPHHGGADRTGHRQALRAGGIDIVELHSHTFDDNPRLFYLHFWANDDAVARARALHTAVAAQNVTPAT